MFNKKYVLDKEDIEAQEMDKCKIVELLDKQEIDWEMVVLPEMPVRTACEQEEFINFNRSLPELIKAEEGLQTDEIELEMLEMNVVEIKVPRKIKLEKPIEQDKSKLHPKQKMVLTSRAVRRANPTGLVKREICRPPPKPPDRQNSLNHKHETKYGRERP